MGSQTSISVLFSCLSIWISANCLSAAPAEVQPKESTIQKRLEVFSRITPQIFFRSPKIQQLVSETATALGEDPRAVKLIRQFNLKGYSATLLKIARSQSDAQVSDEALRYLIANEPADSSYLLEIDDEVTLKLLARNGSERALNILTPTLLDQEDTIEKRQALVRILCTKKNSATLLLNILQNKPATQNVELAKAAVQTLRQTPWSDIQSGFEAFIPSTSPPSIGEEFDLNTLISSPGNIEAGRAVFRSLEHTCVNCHVAENVGNDIGPGLSEIGKKLGKDALFEAILNPSSGISFDYEGWNITLNSGDELTGIVLSKTETQWTIKNFLGQTVEVPVEEIFETQKMTTSLMPSGLGLLLGKDKLVDLVAYLSTLGK
jgi:putative heme-binding domain-containing protein